MTDYKDLIERLRLTCDYDTCLAVMNEAADALEAQQKMIEKLALDEGAFVDLEIRKDSAEQSLMQTDQHWSQFEYDIKAVMRKYFEDTQ